MKSTSLGNEENHWLFRVDRLIFVNIRRLNDWSKNNGIMKKKLSDFVIVLALQLCKYCQSESILYRLIGGKKLFRLSISFEKPMASNLLLATIHVFVFALYHFNGISRCGYISDSSIVQHKTKKKRKNFSEHRKKNSDAMASVCVYVSDNS